MRKPAPPRDLPPPLELVCLRALWRIGEGTVHEVRESVQAAGHELAYTTVLTLLDRLARRGFAGRRKLNRAFVYSAALDEARSREVAVRELVSEWFGGDPTRLVAYLSGPAETPVVAVAPAREATVAAEPEPRIDTALL